MKNYIILFLLFQFDVLNAQTIRVNAFGVGNSEQQAVCDALRNALTQSSSVYISSNVTVINDELVKDELSMINNGSIENYKLVSKINADNYIVVNLDVLVSITKLTSFVESKGGATELKGGLFAANIRLQELNEKSELVAVKNIIDISKNILKNSFDYSIVNGEPFKSGEKWRIPLDVFVRKNSNYDNFILFFYQSLKKIAMSKEDINNYIKLQKPLYTVGLFDSRRHNYSLQKVRLNSQLLSTLPEQNGIKYYCKMNDQDTFKFITNSLKNALRFEKQWTASNYTAWGPAQSGEFACEGSLYIFHDSSSVNHLIFRNQKSFDYIVSFVENLEKDIKDVTISNSIDSAVLNDLFKSNRSSYLTKNSNYTGYEQSANFIITFGANMNSESIELMGKELDYTEYPTMSRRLIRNVAWEKKMLVGFKSTKSKFISFEQCLKITALQENAGYSDGSYFDRASWQEVYLDFVFNDYYDYLNQLRILQYHSGYTYATSEDFYKVRSFPLQLSLIGNEHNNVFMFRVFNDLTTDEISRVSSYKIKKILK